MFYFHLSLSVTPSSVNLDRKSVGHTAVKHKAQHGVFDNDLVTKPKVTLESQARQSVHQLF